MKPMRYAAWHMVFLDAKETRTLPMSIFSFGTCEEKMVLKDKQVSNINYVVPQEHHHILVEKSRRRVYSTTGK